MADDALDHSLRKFFFFGAAALFASWTATHAMAQSVSNKLKIGVIGSGHIGGRRPMGKGRSLGPVLITSSGRAEAADR